MKKNKSQFSTKQEKKLRRRIKFMLWTIKVFTKENILAAATEMEKIKAKWTYMGFHCPKIVYWNVSARGDANIIDKGPDVSFVSGFSPVVFKSVLTGKTGKDLMLEVIGGKRYEAVIL